MAEWTFEVAKRRLRLADDIPADSLRATIAAHPDLYRMPERVRAREILVRTRADADGLLDPTAELVTAAQTVENGEGVVALRLLSPAEGELQESSRWLAPAPQPQQGRARRESADRESPTSPRSGAAPQNQHAPECYR